MEPPVSRPYVRIRWRIFSLLFGFGFLAYLQQKSIAVDEPADAGANHAAGGREVSYVAATDQPQ
jgi:hypothetical protein